MKQRTGTDFSKHEVIHTKSDFHETWDLKKPNTIVHRIKYTNIDDRLIVTGDFGNWIFCRPFFPSPTEGVSDGYWIEKLQISSTQTGEQYDDDGTRDRIQYMIDKGAEEYGYEDAQLSEYKDYLNDMLSYVDEEREYRSHYWDDAPSFIDYEGLILVEKTRPWLSHVFDGFEEICRRMKEEPLKPTQPCR